MSVKNRYSWESNSMITRKYYEKNDGYRYVLSTLKSQIGEEKTLFIVNDAVRKCNEFCREYAELSKKEKNHTEQMIFPRAALYMQMIKYIPKEQATDLLMEAIRIGVEPDIKRLRTLTKPTFMRSVFLLVFSKMLSTLFNEEAGFQTKFFKANTMRLRVDVLQCPYHKYCSLLGCNELTATFCYSDDCIYSNLTGIQYQRNGTIGRGADKCDFDFSRG